MVAGTGRFCTDFMTAIPRAFVKTGAEGVFCGCIAHAGLGIALKIDDGGTRAAQAAMAGVVALLPGWSDAERARIGHFARVKISNRAGLATGEIRAVIN